METTSLFNDIDLVTCPRRGLMFDVVPGMERELDLLLHEVFEKNPYLRHGVSLKDGDCVVDLGANVGIFSAWCTQQASRLRIYACEPVPVLHHLASRNLGRIPGHEIEVSALGVGSSNASRTLTYFPLATACSSFHGDETISQMPQLYSGTKISLRDLWGIHKGLFFAALLMAPIYPLVRPAVIRAVLRRALAQSQTISCPIVSLSALMQRWGIEQIDLLKIDVQGSEVDVLEGIQDADWPRIKAIAMEVNAFLGRSGETDICALLRARGFRVVRHDGDDVAAPGSYFVYACRAPSESQA